MAYLGDIRLEDTIDFKFSTVGTTGAPTTIAGSPTLAAYVGNDIVQITLGLTLSVDFDTVTGLHNVRVVATAANGYAAGTNVAIVMAGTGTVGGTSITGYVVGSFSIQARAATKLLTGTGAVTFASLTVTGAYTQTGAATYANGIAITNATTNGHGITATGDGTGYGFRAVGGATGGGMRAQGGATSGNGFECLGPTSGHGFNASGSGVAKVGINAAGVGTGASHGILAYGSDTGHGMQVQGINSGDGFKAVSPSGVQIRGNITGDITGNLSGTVGSLAAQAKADVNAEVVDALNVDTYAEPGQGAPAATTTLVGKIGYLYKAWRNKSTQTATTYSLMADDALTVDQKATVSDDGTTYSKGEVATGP